MPLEVLMSTSMRQREVRDFTNFRPSREERTCRCRIQDGGHGPSAVIVNHQWITAVARLLPSCAGSQVNPCTLTSPRRRGDSPLVHTFEHPVTGIVEVEPEVFMVSLTEGYTTHESHLARVDLTG